MIKSVRQHLIRHLRRYVQFALIVMHLHNFCNILQILSGDKALLYLPHGSHQSRQNLRQTARGIPQFTDHRLPKLHKPMQVRFIVIRTPALIRDLPLGSDIGKVIQML